MKVGGYMVKYDENRIADLMKTLEISREEVIEMLQDDDDIDHDKPKDFDLTEEQNKVARQYAKSSEHKKSATKQKRTRKENTTKLTIINEIFNFLTENDTISAENLSILNKERQISFAIGDEKYEITLIQKRKPKN